MAGSSTIIVPKKNLSASLRMDAGNVTQPKPEGGGIVNCQYGVGPWERFSLLPQNDGTVAIGSQEFPGSYLRLDGRNVPTGSDSGGGVVNCQHRVGRWEKFRIERQSDNSVALASVAFPGVYLRIDATGVNKGAANGAGTVNAGHGVHDHEKLFLIDSVMLEDDEKLRLMSDLAPLVWLAKGEEYFPSTVEFTFQHTKRFRNDDHGGNYWIRTKQTLDEPSDELPYFQGQRDLTSVPVYAFWVDKPGSVTDIVYYFFFPYNRGKSVASTVWGNHVSDWEHATVRLNWSMTNGAWSAAPYKVALSAHDGGEIKLWSDVEKVASSNHPIVFSAQGSHGVWSKPGDHVYKNLGVTELVDKCSAGTAWNTWGRLLGFDYTSKRGLNADWPVWMSTDYTARGKDPVDDPANGPIYRWGNEARGCDLIFNGLPCRLEDGPEGPPAKDVWKPDNFE